MSRPGRLPDWQERLTTCIAAWGRRAFQYGDWDCALFVAAAVEAQTGRNLRPDWNYRSRADGLRRMRAEGVLDHVAWFQARLSPVALAELRPGDVAVMRGRTLGIVQGRYVYHVVRSGLALASISAAEEGLAV